MGSRLSFARINVSFVFYLQFLRMYCIMHSVECYTCMIIMAQNAPFVKGDLMILENLSERVLSLRKEAKITQAELAVIVGVSRSCIKDLENKLRFSRPEIILKIADYFDVSLDYLYGRTDSRHGKYFYSGEESAVLEPAI